MNELELQIYQLVYQAAEEDKPCPTQKALGKQTKSSYPKISRAWNALVMSGMITVERQAIGYGSIVRINATGKTTSDARFRREGYKDEASALSFRADNLAARIEADQAALRAKQAHWLGEHQRKYGRAHGTRLITDMPA